MGIYQTCRLFDIESAGLITYRDTDTSQLRKIAFQKFPIYGSSCLLYTSGIGLLFHFLLKAGVVISFVNEREVVQSTATVVEQNQYYVDKTMYLPLLEKQPRCLLYTSPWITVTKYCLSLPESAFLKDAKNNWWICTEEPYIGNFWKAIFRSWDAVSYTHLLFLIGKLLI